MRRSPWPCCQRQSFARRSPWSLHQSPRRRCRPRSLRVMRTRFGPDRRGAARVGVLIARCRKGSDRRRQIIRGIARLSAGTDRNAVSSVASGDAIDGVGIADRDAILSVRRAPLPDHRRSLRGSLAPLPDHRRSLRGSVVALPDHHRFVAASRAALPNDRRAVSAGCAALADCGALNVGCGTMVADCGGVGNVVARTARIGVRAASDGAGAASRGRALRVLRRGAGRAAAADELRERRGRGEDEAQRKAKQAGDKEGFRAREAGAS